MPAVSISAFDIIGPSIIGPSSSHTAGAAKLALWAKRIIDAPIKKVTFILQGSFADTYKGHGTDRALLAGLLGYGMADPAIRDAYELADEAGLEYTFVEDHQTLPEHPNTIIFQIETEDGRSLEITGESIGGAQARITKVGDIELQFTGDLNCLMLVHRDRPGILALITSLLADNGVNIASLNNYRHARGRKAYTLLETDNLIESSVVLALSSEPDIHQVLVLKNTPPVFDARWHSSFQPISLGLKTLKNDDGFRFQSAKEAISLCKTLDASLADLMFARERELFGLGSDQVIEASLQATWRNMKRSIEEPIKEPRRSMGGYIGGEAKTVLEAMSKGKLLNDPFLNKAMAYAMAVSEQNASMGLIVAAPTAGGAGVLPGCLLAYQEMNPETTDEAMMRALLVSAAIGFLINLRSSLSGAQGGCQAETGAGAAMAAAALVYLEGGKPETCFEAAGFCLTNLLGLVCDPLGGLVEVPCQLRNAGGAAIALSSTSLALAGLHHAIPFDEITEAHKQVGMAMPETLRETARGGLASTPTAHKCGGTCPY